MRHLYIMVTAEGIAKFRGNYVYRNKTGLFSNEINTCTKMCTDIVLVCGTVSDNYRTKIIKQSNQQKCY